MANGAKKLGAAAVGLVAIIGVFAVIAMTVVGVQQATQAQEQGGATWQQPAEQQGPTVAAVPLNPQDPFPLEYPRWQTLEPGEFKGYNQRASLIQRGHEVYNKYCVGCHGEYGDGLGPAAARLITKPRDFTKGIYKFRSTDSGSLPMEADLYRTIKRGLSRVSMPSFAFMPERDLVAVVEYVKTFYPRWDDEKGRRQLVNVPLAPQDLGDEARIKRGRIVYTTMQCGKCHGVDGAGAGATQTEYADAWGNAQRPFNFTRGKLKGGDDPEDIYRTFHTGLRSIMPAYDNNLLMAVAADTFEQNKDLLAAGEYESLQPLLKDFPASAADVYSNMTDAQKQELGTRNSWDLVAYVLSLRRVNTTAQAVLGKSLEEAQK